MKAEHDPLASHIFVSRRDYRNANDTKGGKRREMNARLSFNTACELGFRGSSRRMGTADGRGGKTISSFAAGIEPAKSVRGLGRYAFDRLRVKGIDKMNRQHGGERYAATEFFDRQKMGILKAFALLWICFAASAWAEAPIDPSPARAMVVPTADGSGKASPSATGTANAFEPEADFAFETGLNYYNGIGVGKDFGEAVKWFRKAAERDYAPAQFFLGLSYYSGHGMPKNDGEAVKWYYKAAEQNYAPAQFGLGVCYEEGQGVPKNNGEAVKWYYKAAEQNLAAADLVWASATKVAEACRKMKAKR